MVDTIDYSYDTSGRQTKQLRAGVTLSERSYGADGTLAWRKDGDAAVIGQSSFTYDWAQRLLTVDLPDATFSTATPTFGWRLDGLIGSRTWSGTTATFGYDGAKRVTSLTKGALTLSQTYNSDGNVTTEARTLTGVTGDPGSGTQTFSYDALGRVTQSTGLASGTRAYTYDRDSNRLTKSEGGITFTYTYDRTDELLTVIKTGGTSQSFSYDAYGNQIGDAQTGAAVTAMAYDLTGHLTSIDAAGTANDATFTLDALGRFRTRVLVTGGTDTYSYIDTSEVVTRIANSGGTTTDSIVSPTGDRLGVKVGATVNWFLPDLHGDIAASLDSTEATVVNAIRYDAYGQTIGTGTAGGTRVGADAWKYQGRLDISPTGLGTPLYDMSARFYNPGIGAFTQFDSVLGTAQNPISMHRFLYANGNPATLTDPTGHSACSAMADICTGPNGTHINKHARGDRDYRSVRRSRFDQAHHGLRRYQPRRIGFDKAHHGVRPVQMVGKWADDRISLVRSATPSGELGPDFGPALVVAGGAVILGAACIVSGVCELAAAGAGVVVTAQLACVALCSKAVSAMAAINEGLGGGPGVPAAGPAAVKVADDYVDDVGRAAEGLVPTVKSAPKPALNFKPPTNPPQLPPTSVPTGWRVSVMKPTEQYPTGYWKLEKPMGNDRWQPIDPSTMKPGRRWETHVPLPGDS